MEDLLSCTVCCEPYQEKTRHPVLLPRCGHTFCRPCISFLVKKGCIICPSCRTDQRVEGVDTLPTEFSLLAISLAQQVTKQETCQEHGVKLSFWCKTCNKPACGECLFEDHPMTSHNVIKSTAYVDEMKESVTNITNKFMEALDGREKCFFEKIFNCTKMINDALRTVTVLRKDMEEARDLMKGVKIVEGIASTQTLSEAAKFLGLKWNLQDVNLNLKAVGLMTGESKVSEEADSKDEGKGSEIGSSVNNDDVASENGTKEKEKADDEKEKDDAEDELLTEEQIKKKRKMQRIKEKMAAASAAIELADLEAKEKSVAIELAALEYEEKMESKREKTESSRVKKAEDEGKEAKSSNESKEKNNAVPQTSRDAYDKVTKNLKPWQRRHKPWEPTPREPSITPEKEIIPTKPEEKEPQKSTNETEQDNKVDKNNETDQNKITEGQSKEDVTRETTKDSNKDTNATTNATESSSMSKTDDDSKKEGNTDSKKSLVPKKPRGRMARNALKRAQTMDFSKRLENPDLDTNNDTESENIKGLDLETHNANKSNEEQEVDNKEAEAQASGENAGEKEETKVEEQKETKQEDNVAAKPQKDMFEMEPEEKERIATELMQVPSLTVVIEGIGGLLSRVAWESMGLHIYCHQFQELPYDVIVKSNVLHAVIPTKDPMVFLDIVTDDQVLGRVYITLWGHLRRANNFLLLCLGDRGRSLRLSRLFKVLNEDAPGERLLGGDYEYNDGRGGESLVDDLEYQGKYSMPMEMGMVTSASSGNRALDSQFYVCTEEDLNRQFACPFGRVTVGLPVLKEAVWLVVTQQVYIQDCGVVLDWPRI